MGLGWPELSYVVLKVAGKGAEQPLTCERLDVEQRRVVVGVKHAESGDGIGTLITFLFWLVEHQSAVFVVVW